MEQSRFLNAFESAWKSQHPPDISEYVSKIGHREDESTLIALLELDLKYRWSQFGQEVQAVGAGEVPAFPSVADYCSVLELSLSTAAVFDLVVLEFHLRQECGDAISSAKLIERNRLLLNDEQIHQLNANLEQTVAQSRRPIQDLHRSNRIGPYRILQKIAEGGMGAVYMADQEKPIRRRVALKVIKAGRDSDKVIARFEAERQALAMMDHPNIAKILDAGSDKNGSPYFVMELVKGVPITEYCDRHTLSVEERLQLFIPVCQAVQHAHLKGIIHRDLKPSNVLVGIYDGRPIAKVIDFGLAKATQHATRLTDKTMFTEFGNVVGTLQYMSPEQAGSDQLDIDTRTDVYSLGVMLYELLTGSTPLDQQTMKKKALLNVLEVIREKDPPRPSNRLSTTETASEVGLRRKIAPEKLRRVLRGELDWIVMKALEKDRIRRYETAAGFAEDIEHFLNNETVVARPPTVGYRLSKLIHANRGLAAAVVVVLGVLLSASVIAGWFAVDARIAREKEHIAREDAESAKDRAEREAQNALIAKAKETRARQDREETLSSTNFDLAVARWALHRPGDALSLLDKVSEEHRHFEWHFARNQFLSETRAIECPSLISGIAVSPDGTILASANGKPNQDIGRIDLWDAGSGTKLRELDVASESVNCIEFSPDGRTLAAGFDGFVEKKDQKNQKVRIFDVSTGSLLGSFAEQTTAVDNIAFNSDGSLIAVESGELFAQTINIFNARTFQLKKSISIPDKIIDDLQIRGTRVFVSGKSGRLRRKGVHVYDLESGVFEKTVAQSSGGWTFDVSSSGNVLVAAQFLPPRLHVWDLTTDSSVDVLDGHLGEISAINIAPDELTFASASVDGTVRIWDIQTGKQIRALKSDFVQALEVEYGPDSQQIFCTGYTSEGANHVKVWDLDKFGGRVIYSRTPTFRPIMLRGDRVATVNERGELDIWSTDPFAVERRIKGFPSSEYVDLRFSSDETLVTGITLRGELVTFQVGGTSPPDVSALYPQGERIYNGRIRPDEVAVFLRAGFDESTQQRVTFVDAWDIPTRQKRWTTILPDGTGYFDLELTEHRLITRFLWRKMHFFVLDLETGNVVTQAENANGWMFHEESTNCVYVPIKNGSKHHLRVYDLQSGMAVQDSDSIKQYDSHLVKGKGDLVALSKWSDIELVDRETLRTIDVLQGRSAGILDIVFHPHENRLISTYGDQSLRIWDIDTRKELFNVSDVDMGYHGRPRFDSAGNNVVVPVNSEQFQIYFADQSERPQDRLISAERDPDRALSSRIRWYAYQIELAQARDDLRTEVFYRAWMLKAEPDNLVYYLRFRDSLENYQSTFSIADDRLPAAVRTAKLIEPGAVDAAWADELLLFVLDLVDQEKDEQVIDLVAGILSSSTAAEIDEDTLRQFRGCLGMSLARQGKSEKALEHLRFARELEPKLWVLKAPAGGGGNAKEPMIVNATRFSLSYAEIIERADELDELAEISWEDWQRLSGHLVWEAFDKVDKVPSEEDGEQFCEYAERIAENLLLCRKFEQAKVIYNACVRLRERLNPEKWTTWNTRSRFGECLLAQGQTGAALSKLEQAWNGLLSIQHDIPQSRRDDVLHSAAARLISACEKLEDESRLKKYRAQLDQLGQ